MIEQQWRRTMKRFLFIACVFLTVMTFSSLPGHSGDRVHGAKNCARETTARAEIQFGDLALPKPLKDRAFIPDDIHRPIFSRLKAEGIRSRSESVPQPESLCDPGYYWMGGETWTSDTDGSAIVWGAGGNLYFSSAGDPASALEMWWGDIALRVRIHNSMAYVFSYYYTYVFDVSNPVNPSFLNYAPGFYYAYNDAIPTPDDNYLIYTDLMTGDACVWSLADWKLIWTFSSPIGGFYIPMCIPEDSVSQGNTLILGDWGQSYYDFWDISDLECSPPTFIGQILNATPSNPSGSYDTGNIMYKYPYLYGNYEPWQHYNPWVGTYFGGPDPDETCWISVHHIPDVSVPSNNYLIREFTDVYDLVSMKDSGTGVMLTNYQGRVALYNDQLSDLINEGFFSPSTSYATYDAGYSAGGGVAACGPGGARFFDTGLSETSHYTTGGYAYDVIPAGDYLYVPSGSAGLAILDNSDPTWPVTLSFLEPDNVNFSEVKYVSVSGDGNYCYISDGTNRVWTVNVTAKNNPVLISPSTPYITSAGTITKLFKSWSWGTRECLVVGTSSALDLVDVNTDPAVPVRLDAETITGGVTGIANLSHSSYPGQQFLGVTSPTTFYTYLFYEDYLTDAGSIAGFTNISGIAIANNVAYLISSMNADIHPVSISGPLPFALSTAGTTILNIGWSWGTNPSPPLITKLSEGTLAASGDHAIGGYPAVFLISIVNPLAPAFMPSGQTGVYPFDMLTGLNSGNGMVYYATDYFGIGALSLEPDYDIPQIVNPPGITVSPIYYDAGGVLYIQKTVNLSVSVMDPTSAITRVRFEFYDGTAWRRIVEKTNSTPAGIVGTYTYAWDTTNWAYGNGNGQIRVQVEDSGCNITTLNSADTYHINTVPSYDITWNPGCNAPPGSGSCFPSASSWVVCGSLCFSIWASPGAENLVNNGSIDDITQIAYAIDGGAWNIYDIPGEGTNPQNICLDTTTLSDGLHTLTVRVTDECSIQGFKDSTGKNSWSFTVDNHGPQVFITSPLSGASVGGSAVHVAAHPYNELALRPVSRVDFYIDPSNLNDPLTGTLIGSSTSKDGNGDFSFEWDSRSFPLGQHIIIALVWEDSVCSCGPFKTPPGMFNLIFVEEIPPEIATGSSGADAQGWSEDKTTQSWPSEPTATGGYRLYRGTLSQLPSLLTSDVDSCLKYEGTSTSVDLSSDDPSGVEGGLYWYLVTAYNGAGEGPAGNGTAGIRIVNSTGTCIP